MSLRRPILGSRPPTEGHSDDGTPVPVPELIVESETERRRRREAELRRRNRLAEREQIVSERDEA